MKIFVVFQQCHLFLQSPFPSTTINLSSFFEELCFWLLSQHLLPCHVMKMCRVCYYNNSNATFRLLMSGDINPNPGPVSASTAGNINFMPRDECQKLKKLSQRQRKKDLVYAENSDFICVNERAELCQCNRHCGLFPKDTGCF